ncbi:MAG: type II secretion system F family protein [candidate division KSB1 bacterium]|nr:type II secretion system F family protein [candidate division KSB1 bacterium]
MPTFSYKAVTYEGEIVQRTMEASDRRAVLEFLDKSGMIPLEVNEARGLAASGLAKVNLSGQKKVKLEDLVLFTKQLVTLLKAGVPLLSSLEALYEQSEHPTMRQVISDLYRDVEGGSSLSDAMAKHKRVFPELYVNSVRAGELSGALDQVLERLSTLLEHDKATRTKVKSAMRYPLIVIASLGVAAAALMTFVVPRFAEMFLQSGMELPLPTKILIAASNGFKRYWHIGAGALFAGFVFFKQFTRTERGRYEWDRFKLKLPVFGPLVLKVAMSRFARMFQTLNSSGMPILQTLDIVAETVGNEVVKREIRRVSDGVRRGEGIADPLRQSKLFPPMVVRMIAIGEQSGSLDNMLYSISEHYDLEVDYAVKNLTTMIEPMLTVGLGIIVVFFALSIFLPMWSMTNLAQ